MTPMISAPIKVPYDGSATAEKIASANDGCGDRGQLVQQPAEGSAAFSLPTWTTPATLARTPDRTNTLIWCNPTFSPVTWAAARLSPMTKSITPEPTMSHDDVGHERKPEENNYRRRNIQHASLTKEHDLIRHAVNRTLLGQDVR